MICYCLTYCDSCVGMDLKLNFFSSNEKNYTNNNNNCNNNPWIYHTHSCSTVSKICCEITYSQCYKKRKIVQQNILLSFSTLLTQSCVVFPIGEITRISDFGGFVR